MFLLRIHNQYHQCWKRSLVNSAITQHNTSNDNDNNNNNNNDNENDKGNNSNNNIDKNDKNGGNLSEYTEDELNSNMIDESVVDEELEAEVNIFAKFERTKTTLRLLYDFGKIPNRARLLLGAKFLHRELPVRFARRVLDLDALPHGLALMKTVKLERDEFLKSFKDLRRTKEPLTMDLELEFTDVLRRILYRHRLSSERIAQGIVDLKNHESYHESSSTSLTTTAKNGKEEEEEEYYNFQPQLDNFHRTRISICLLIGQHLANHSPRKGWIGLIEEVCRPADVVKSVADKVSILCKNQFDRAPIVNLYGHVNATFPYVTEHLEFMVTELLMNSMRATAEFHHFNNELPTIRVVISEGLEDISIKVEDQGGGIPESAMNKLFSYSYSTAKPSSSSSSLRSDVSNKFEGFGFGLPICQLYAQYFGGDLKFFSMESYGTDAFLFLPHVDKTTARK